MEFWINETTGCILRVEPLVCEDDYIHVVDVDSYIQSKLKFNKAVEALKNIQTHDRHGYIQFGDDFITVKQYAGEVLNRIEGAK